MIVGDRKALKATLTHGISDILQEVVDLYSVNLNQLGVQTTVLAGLVYTAVMAPNWFKVGQWNNESIVCSAFYTFLIQTAMAFSVLAMIVSTLASSFGPSLTLTGKDSKMIIYAVRSMQQVQEYAFWLSAISIALILCAIPFYAFSEYRFGHAVIIVIMSFFGSLFILRKGMVTLQSNRFSGMNCLNAILRAFEGGDEEGTNKKPMPPPPMTYEDYLWKRKPPHKGDGYTYLYCLLRNGRLFFFRDKVAYDVGDEPVMEIKLRYLRLTLDHKLFYRPARQISLSLFGESFIENKLLQFALLPLEDHEILTYDTSFEFQAVDEHSFEQWREVLAQVEEYFKEVNGNPLAAILENLK